MSSIDTTKITHDTTLWVRDLLINNITDPITTRVGTSAFVETKYPDRDTQYPCVTVNSVITGDRAAGIGTESRFTEVMFEIRVWAKSVLERDNLADSIYNTLTKSQLGYNDSALSGLHNLKITSMVDIDEEGSAGLHSKIIEGTYILTAGEQMTVYTLNQNLNTTDDVTFKTVTLTGSPILLGTNAVTKDYVDNTISGENMWDRAGSILYPFNANDNVSGVPNIFTNNMYMTGSLVGVKNIAIGSPTYAITSTFDLEIRDTIAREVLRSTLNDGYTLLNLYGSGTGYQLNFACASPDSNVTTLGAGSGRAAIYSTVDLNVGTNKVKDLNFYTNSIKRLAISGNGAIQCSGLNVNGSITADNLTLTTAYNPFDQNLNTTDDVTFSTVSATNVSATSKFSLSMDGNFRVTDTRGEVPVNYDWLYPYDTGGGTYSQTSWMSIPATAYNSVTYQGGFQFYSQDWLTLFGGIDGVDGHLHWQMPVEFHNDLTVAGATKIDKLGLNGATANGNYLLTNYNGATGNDYISSFWDSTGGLYENIYFEGGGIKRYTPNNEFLHAGTSIQLNTDWSNIILDAGQSGEYYYSQNEIRIGGVGQPKLNFVNRLTGNYDVDLQRSDEGTLMVNEDFIARNSLQTNKLLLKSADPNELLYYKFDELSGTIVNDYSSVGVNGSATNWDAGGWNYGGKIGNGCLFSVWLATSYVDSNQDTPFQFGSGNFTLNIWAKNAGAADDYYIGKDDTSGNYYGIGMDASANAFFDIGGTRANLLTTANRWHMITGVRSGNNIGIYVDGVAGSIIDVSGLTADAIGNNLLIGGRNATTYPLTQISTLDEARVFGRALSPTEVLDLYHSKLGTGIELSQSGTSLNVSGNIYSVGSIVSADYMYSDKFQASAGNYLSSTGARVSQLNLDSASYLKYISGDDVGIYTDSVLRQFIDISGNTTHYGNSTVSGNLYVNGTILGNIPYGGMFLNTTSGVTIPIGSANIFYTFTGLTSGLLNGFDSTPQSGILIPHFNGVYKSSYVAAGVGANNHTYRVAVFVNGSIQLNTESHMLAAAGDVHTMAGIGHISLQSGNTVELKIEDVGGTGNGTVYTANINLERIGN